MIIKKQKWWVVLPCKEAYLRLASKIQEIKNYLIMCKLDFHLKQVRLLCKVFAETIASKVCFIFRCNAV
jgi:hypothetical protein